MARIAGLLILVACGASPPSQPQRAPAPVAQPSTPAPTPPPPAPVPAVKLPVVMRPQTGHRGTIYGGAISPDGTLVATGAQSNDVKVWDVETGALVRTFRGHQAGVNVLAFDPDGRHLVSGGTDKAMFRWDIVAGTGVRIAAYDQMHGQSITALAFAAGGSRWISGAADKRAIVHDQTSGIDLVEKTSIGDHGAILSPDGARALTVSWDHEVRLWDAWAGKVIRELGKGDAPIAYSPDGKLVGFATRDGIVIADGTTGAELRKIAGVGRVVGVAFTADSKQVRIAYWRESRPERPSRIETFDVTGGAVASKTVVIPIGGRDIAFSADARRAFDYDMVGQPTVYDLETGAVVRAFDAHLVDVRAIDFAPRGNRLIATDSDGWVRMWDLDTLSLLWTTPTQTTLPEAIKLTADGRRAVMADERTLYVLDAVKGGIVKKVEWQTSKRDSIADLAITPDGKRAVTGNIGRTMTVWDLERGTTVRTIRGDFEHNVWVVALSPDGRIAAGGSMAYIRLVDLETGKELRRLDGHHRTHDTSVMSVSRLAFSRDGKRLYSVGPDHKLIVWDVKTGAQLAKIDDAGMHTAAFADNGKRMLGIGRDEAALWDLTASTPVQQWKMDPKPFTFSGDAALSPDGSLAATVMDDGMLRLWRTESGASIVLVAAQREWLAYTDDGYFDASRNGGSLVAAVEGKRVFRVGQLAARNNRPDLVFGRVGLGSPELLEHFGARYQRRLKRLGLRERDLDAGFDGAPVVEIAQVTQSAARAELTLDLRAREGELLRYDVFVNGVPVPGATGVRASGKSQRVTVVAPLTNGINRIEASAVSTRGVESLRALRLVEAKDLPRGDLYVIALGVSRYQDRGLDLAFAHKDARDIAAAFQRAKAGFGAVHTTVLVDDQVTVAAVRSLKSVLAKAKPEDTLVLFVAGHGVHADDAAADYLFVTHEADVTRLRETTAPFELFEEILVEAAPRQKLFLMDTCESGERDDEEARVLAAAAGQRGLRARSTRKLAVIAKPATSQPDRSTKRLSRKHLFERERFIYNDLARRTGAIVLSSSRGSELSYERAEWQNGAFTAELKLAFSTRAADKNKDGKLSTDELREFVAAGVARRTNDLQHPTVDRDNPDMTLVFPLAP